MKNIAIIPARSGSKGLKDKNIKDLCGRPMLSYSIEAAKKSLCFDKILVSTDSDLYADIAIRYGAEVPFLRSDELSGDDSGSWEVVDEVLNKYNDLGHQFDTVCILQPTSPLREYSDIIAAYRQMELYKADSITSVCEAEHTGEVYLYLQEDLSLKSFREARGFYLPRQKGRILYRINGAIYIRKINYEGHRVVTLSEEEYAYAMKRINSIDIDDEMDFSYAEMILRNNGGHK